MIASCKILNHTFIYSRILLSLQRDGDDWSQCVLMWLSWSRGTLVASGSYWERLGEAVKLFAPSVLLLDSSRSVGQFEIGKLRNRIYSGLQVKFDQVQNIYIRSFPKPIDSDSYLGVNKETPFDQWKLLEHSNFWAIISSDGSDFSIRTPTEAQVKHDNGYPGEPGKYCDYRRV